MILHLFFFVTLGCVYNIQCDQECSRTICNPKSGDLLIGRESLLRASSTCGLDKLERYCVVTLIDNREEKCFLCNSKDRYNKFSSENSHRVENLVSRVPQDPGRWWQSAHGIENVSIEISFESEFQMVFTHLRFKRYRPAAMYIERSNDYGRTWRKSAYFSDNCARDFPHVPDRQRYSIDEVSCTGEFSKISPSEGGTVFFMATPSDLHTKDKNWIERRNEITAITNLRVQFVRLHTFGDSIIDNNPDIKRKYYYAVSEWIIRGRCSCYGHAARCKPKEGQMEQKEMVYGVCVCQHNTMGQHCEKCKDFYNDRPWMPAEANATNECTQCECNKHSSSCHFNPVLFESSGSKSGGMCDNCQHNTEGKNCERCKGGYYRNLRVHISSVETCIKCKCNPHGSNYPSLCVQEDDPEKSLMAGNCICKDNVGGYDCDKCKIGFWNFSNTNDQGCTKCKCFMPGTLGNQGCNEVTGDCLCKSAVDGEICNICKEGFYNLSSSNPSGCSHCGCNKHSSIDPGKCDKSNGQCRCKEGYFGRTCNEVKDGWFIDTVQYPLPYRESVQIELPPVSKSGYYNFIITIDTSQMLNVDTYMMILTIDQPIKTTCSTYEDSISITKETKKIVVPNKCLVKDLPIVVNIFVFEKPKDSTHVPSIIDIVVVPMLYPNSTATRDALAACLKFPPGSMPERCKFLEAEQSSKAVSNSNPKACGCNVTGSIDNICNKVGGQCNCLPNVVGRQCDKCMTNSYGFDARGCKDCECEPKGSLNLQCAADTGKCLCRPGVEGRHCNYCKNGFWRFPFCDPCKCHSMADVCDQQSGQCINCKGNSFGFNCQQCNNGYYGDPTKNLPCLKCNCPGLSFNLNHSIKCSLIFNTSNYMCVCKPQYKGQYCDECQINHYGNPRSKNGMCSPCECSSNIDKSVPGSCDTRTGECKKCLYNTAGFNCEKCAPGFFGVGMDRTCKQCVCNQLGTQLKAPEMCHHETGKCPCLANVIGQQCDKCQSGFYNVSSGQGCLPCNCDSNNGALNSTCNTLTGQCHCRKSRSGRQCDKCEDGYWGDPRLPNGCKVCQCNQLGSLFNQCDRNSGACRCRPGITGRYCDSCARGTDGKMPDCTSCGDCWVQWDQSIGQMMVSIEQFQKMSTENVSTAAVPEGLLALIKDMKIYIDYMKTIMKNVPEDMTLKIIVVENKLNILRQAIDEMKAVNFNLSQHDSTNITRAIAEMKELVASNKIQNFRGAYDFIVQCFSSVKDADSTTKDSTLRLKNKRNEIKNQEDLMKTIDLNYFGLRLKHMTDLRNSLESNLNHFNKLTCSSISGNGSELCTDPCGGIGCQPNSCSRTRPVGSQCLKGDQQKFFNAQAWKLEKRKISDEYLKGINDDLKKKVLAMFTDTDSLLDYQRKLIRVPISITNYRYNWSSQLLADLGKTLNRSMSEDEFKMLLTKISTFKISTHEAEIKRLEDAIKERMHQLENKVKDVLNKSEENRKECDRLKEAANKEKEKATNLLMSIKDLDNNHKIILKLQDEAKLLLANLDLDRDNIKNELRQIKGTQNEAKNYQKKVNEIISALKVFENAISTSLKEIGKDFVVLEREQHEMKAKLEVFKSRAENVLLRRDRLNEDRTRMSSQDDSKRQEMLLRLNQLNGQIQRFRKRNEEARSSIEQKKMGLIGLSQTVEEQLQTISSLENEIYRKSEYQTSCLP